MPGTAERLDLRAAAAELGVHYQTAYRWVRTGQLDAHLVNGRYLVNAETLTALAERRSQPVSPASPGSKRLAATRTKMHVALTTGDETEARRLARSIVDEGTSVTDLIQLILVPPLRQIGIDWHEGRLSIWVEHRASSITERILGDVSPNPRGRRRGTAMVAAVAGDMHALATSMAAAALREDNWHVHHLGANVPTAEVLDFCLSQGVDLVVLTLVNPDCAATAAEAASNLERMSIPVIVGAPGRTLADLKAEARAALTSAHRANATANERARDTVDSITT
jgi:MerR family transcriptional regulator, light-induced transcriptional regulator